MRIPDQSPGLALCGAALSYVSRGDIAANGASGTPGTAAQAMAAVHDARPGFSQEHGDLARAVQVAQAVAQALDGADSCIAIHAIRMAPCGPNGAPARLFGGEHACL